MAKKRKHTQEYMRYFGYGEQDLIPCEMCPSTAVDIHHITYRSRGGGDHIGNLIALCRDCHDSAHKGDISFDRLTRPLQ